MFTYIKVLSSLVVRGGLYVWNMNHWDKQQVTGWAKTNKLGARQVWAREGLSLTLGRGQDGRIRKVRQGIAAEVCINVYNKFIMIVYVVKPKNVICRVRD
jgi:hypothetical protein